ncbi:MAG: hypothetical protein V4721_10205 [Bacteroidota bacterium]
MGQIELYEGLIYIIPDAPKRDQILNYNKPRKDQKWVRTELPENYDYLSKEEQEAFAFEEDRKCREGIHLYVNGIITFITGDHYHYLNWFKIDSGYPEYRDRDRRWFYHWHLCDIDTDCIGQCYGKLRRDGYSYRVDSIILNRARVTFDSNYGIVSKSGDDAKEMFAKLIHGFLAYPPFFKPQVRSAEDVQKELIFKTPQQRITQKTRVTKKEISLNTKINYKATSENAYDGMKLKILAADETGKWIDANVEKWYNIAKTCVTLGGRIIGKMLFGSTVNESAKGGANFLAIWNKSSILKKTGNNRTDSGLWRYFVPAYDGLEGFIDEYGMSVIETPETPVIGIDGHLIKIGAKPFLENERLAKKNSGDMVGYYEELRQRPFTEAEMFMNPANDKPCWDIAKIHQQIENNAIVMVDRTIVHGYFEWANGVRDCGVVEWHPLEKDNPMCKHSFTWLPEVQDRNKFVMHLGKKAPANTHVGLFTLDPYAAVNTVDKRQSKAASHGFKKFDFMAPKNLSDVFIMEYWNRLRDPLLVYEDMIMQCVFFGWALLPERNIRNANDYFRNRDYHNYLLQAPNMTQEDYIKSVGKVQDAGIANTDGKTQQQMIEYLASYISNNVGVNERTGEMGYMPFDNTLKDWLEFDIDKWTPYDLTISSMVAVVGSRGIVQPKKKVTQINLFPTYKRVGNTSTRIQ